MNDKSCFLLADQKYQIIERLTMSARETKYPAGFNIAARCQAWNEIKVEN